MLDQANSSPNPHRLPTEGALAPSPQQPEADPAPLPEPTLQAGKPDDPLYTIRVAENPGALCSACGSQETGAGPVGYRDDEPVCDLCLLQANSDLGLLLAVAAVVRAYAATTQDEQQEALAELSVFARIYHRVASQSWPPRIFRIPGFVATNDTTH